MSKTDNAIRDQAYQFFEQEALELLQVLEDGLLTLRTQSDLPHVHQLMRAAHSIKGGAASVGLPGIQKIAHKLEDILRALYRREDPINEALEGALLQAFDCLRVPLQAQIELGHYDEAAAWEQAEPIFSFLETVLAKDLGADIELPTAAELGIDIVHEVFTGDVQREMDRLAGVLQHPDVPPIDGEVRATADIFFGIGELLGLPGLAAIAQATIQALEANPRQALEIGALLLNDMRNAQVVVLGGDREQGGSPSEALIALTQPQHTAENSLETPLGGSSEFTESGFTASDFGDLDDFFGAAPAPSESIQFFDTAPLSPDSEYGDLEGLFSQNPLNLDESSPLEVVSPSLDAGYGDLDDFFGQAAPALEESSTTAWSEIEISPVSAEVPAVIQSTVDTPIPAVLVESTPSNKKPQDSKAPATNASTVEGTVRVDFLRLDRLNNLVGELVTQENGSLLQAQQLQSKLKGLQQRFSAFEQLSKNLQNWMDESLKAGIGKKQSSVSHPEANGLGMGIDGLADFDPLLMDSYSALYMMVQDGLEEIAQMGETMGDMTLITQQAQTNQRKKQQTLKQVRNDLLWARMMPIGEILRRFPRMVRDLAAEHGKKVSFKQFGETTPVDKSVLERLYDPLVHLIRNSFDHGTETPEERVAQGKSPEAAIEIRAYHRGNQTFIEIKDDGRGIDPDVIRAAAVRQGFLTSEAAVTATPQELYQFMFESSFSTRTTVSDLSGRGMGLTAVKIQIEALKGKIAIASEMGQGTTFTISLPLTLTIAKLLVFSVDSNYMAIPVDTLLGIISVDSSELPVIQGRPFYRYQDRLLPLYPPSSFVHHYPLPKGLSEKKGIMSLSQKDKIPLLLVANGDDVLALEVDRVLDEQELVIKPFGAATAPPDYLYGCAILGDGTLVPVVDGSVLIRKWKGDQVVPAPVSTPTKTRETLNSRIPTILVIDDSLTARQTLTLTLQKFGYQVIQAGDGREGMEKLRQESSIQAVFCDVEMPTMNGFEFLSASRKEYPAETLPIIMLTSRSGDKHRGIAKLLGANDYLTKPYLEQELLKTLQACLEPVKC
jgi:two-component system, chemotaxis family, sensor histidine kinase and response regulator PixL